MRDRDDASRTRTALSRGLNGFTRWEQCLATPSPMNTRRCPRHGDIGKGKQGHAGEMLAGCLEIAPRLAAQTPSQHRPVEDVDSEQPEGSGSAVWLGIYRPFGARSDGVC
ncbi:hypothetical protein JEQ12_008595 [Ovis aries]|uniref:Uncharacterized protein n=1 Tax=Ovis aries TaxID=9940 RepID=A0A835ZVN5_SHEEP|nr:hypothetical protein JEQ12_008595 [Ovis aries]